jgi:hypothetical protein
LELEDLIRQYKEYIKLGAKEKRKKCGRISWLFREKPSHFQSQPLSNIPDIISIFPNVKLIMKKINFLFEISSFFTLSIKFCLSSLFLRVPNY